MNLLTEEHLSYLPKDLIEKAKTMSKAYEYIYCIENLIRLHLINRLGNDFIQSEKVSRGINLRKQDELSHKWIPVRGQSDIYYTDFKELEGIIDQNWEKLHADFPDRFWIISKISDLARLRNMIAHNSSLEKSDFEIIRAYFNVISRQLNLPKNYQEQVTDDCNEEGFVKGLQHSKIYSYTEICNGIIHALVYPLDLNVTPEFIKTEFEQIAPTFLVSFKDSGKYLYPELQTYEVEYLEEKPEIHDRLKVQIGQFDIDSDGIDEIFICLQSFDISDETTNNLVINVFKYYPPALQIHANREENWKHFEPFATGSIFGEPIAELTENSIYISRNFKHYYDKWTFFNGDFIHDGI